jgi:hypothetical protein
MWTPAKAKRPVTGCTAPTFTTSSAGTGCGAIERDRIIRMDAPNNMIDLLFIITSSSFLPPLFKRP